MTVEPPVPPSPTPAAPVSAPVVSPSPPRVAAPTDGHRKRWWAFAAGVLGALAVVAAVAALVGRSSPSSSSPPSTSARRSGVAGWFAAASGPTCRPATAAEALPGVVDAVRCTSPNGVRALFAQTSSPAGVGAYLASVETEHPRAEVRPWAGGELVAYGTARAGVLVWTYTGQPYVGEASGERSALDAWWANVGRVRT